MKKNSFIGGALISTLGIVIVKILGVFYVIPFNAMIGEKGGALYGYGYNIYALFLSISSAGIPFAVSKLTSEYLAIQNKKMVSEIYRISKKIIFIFSMVMFTLLFTLANPIAKMIAVSGTGGNTVKDICLILRLVSFAILVVPFLSVTRGFLQGHKIITPGSISQVIEQLVRVVIIISGCYLAINVFKVGLTNAVGISVFAAFIGGAVSLLYLQLKLYRSNLLTKEKESLEKKQRSTIIKKLCFYAIPYVLISAISNLYEITDMIIVQRVMSDILHIDAVTTEIISSIFTIWGGKFNGIILALIIGLNTSLIPNIVTSFAKGNIEDVSNKINTSLECILFIIVPLTFFISMFSGSLWTLFYGPNEIGTIVYKYFVFYALFGGAFTVIVNVLQGLSKYKEVVISMMMGLIFNVLFDAPFMLLFHKIGLQPANGAVVCGLVGYTISIIYSITILFRRYDIKFNKVFLRVRQLLNAWIVFLICLILVRNLVPMNLTGRIVQIPILGVSFMICFGVYFLFCYFTGCVNDLFLSLIPNKKIFKYLKKLDDEGEICDD